MSRKREQITLLTNRTKLVLSSFQITVVHLALVARAAYHYNSFMKLLRQALIDYEAALLSAIADCRGVSFDTSHRNKSLDQLVEAILSPVATAIILDDLSTAEREALQFLLKHSGQIEGPRFTRQFGAIRSMGSGRLERERPWQNPANPAEGLWYRGLIFKAFQVTGQGSQEVVYIPDDLLPLLSPVRPQPGSSQNLKITPSSAPAFIITCPDRLRENIFSLLVYLQTTPVRIHKTSELTVKTKQALAKCLLPPFLPTFTPVAETEFLLHLGQRTNLLTIAHGRLRPERDATRRWLQTDPARQLEMLQNTWRADPTWNDLWHVPDLRPQSTGWDNSPLRARSKILGYLEQIAAPTNKWLSIADFISIIKDLDPDFQRPDGDYESWYIQDTNDNFLMGFEHWDKVEGALIYYLLTHILPLLGAIDLGCPNPAGNPVSFRLTPLGETFLQGRSMTSKPAKKPAFLRVNNKFQVRVPAQASLYDRFQLARLAELEHRDNDRAIYHITRASLSRAAKNGVTPDQITAFLTRATNNQIPLNVVERVRAWGTRFGTVKLEQAMILHVKDAQLAAELRQIPAINRLLGEALGPTAILVSSENASELRQLLTEQGYLE